MTTRRGVRLSLVLAILGSVTSLAWLASTLDAQAPPELVARGQYLVGIMDCAGCHTGGALLGKPDPKRYLAGSEIGFDMGPEVGVVYPKNLTPDREAGLGAWTDAEIIRAIRQGQSRDGRPLAPIMPWPSYAALTDEDARAVLAYLRSISPVKFVVPRNARPGEKASSPYLTVVVPK